jgi:hypothetical protein
MRSMSRVILRGLRGMASVRAPVMNRARMHGLRLYQYE